MVLCKSRDPGNHFSMERVSKEKIFALHANLSRIVRDGAKNLGGVVISFCEQIFATHTLQ